MENTVIISTDKELVLKAISTLSEIGNNDPSMREIRTCIKGLKNGEEFARKCYSKNKAS